MEPPMTRRESKKDPKAKAKGKTIYSAKHIRIQQAQAQAANKKP